MRAEVLAIGTELLLGQINDTNSARIAGALADAGIDVLYTARVGDNHERIVSALHAALGRVGAVVCTGGLGPTQDDITREAIAEVMGVELTRRPDIEDHIRSLFAARNRAMPESNLSQADVPEGATAIPPAGTAPGLICPLPGGKVIYAMPGVPWEMEQMLTGAVLPDVTERAGERRVIASRVLRTWGLAESAIAERLAAQFSRLEVVGNPTMAFLAGGGEIRVRLTASAPSQVDADALIDREDALVRSVLGEYVFGVDGDTMEVVLGRELVARNQTLAIAESVTGGLLAERLTMTPGASSWLRGAVVAYSPAVKVELLDVRAELIDGDKIVSEATALAMAEGAARRLDADWGIGITGEAGPEPATSHPVGTVCVGWATRSEPADGNRGATTLLLPGDRRRIQEFASAAAINLLRRAITAAM